ncbi:DsbA family protein [Uliginosibacterium sp. H3]|uniref:DsbA family protein n=1 Tax=Uliginosibacterium silvisoli TaxID=3114758 RepID=A0ABU6JYG2_9RHOO|nr:DsbA family protein [Uliginosibacterium sp. H3]
MTIDPSAEAPQATLHYIFDPLCGWCYAASPLLRAFSSSPLGESVALRLHPGLLFEGPRELGLPFRQHILEADQRIHQLTGVPFGAPYIARVKNPAPIILDSTLPSLSVLAAEALAPAAGLDMLEAIQQAHYEAGHDVCQPERLQALAIARGLPADAFDAMQGSQREALFGEVRIARAMLQASGGQGFPTFVLETGKRRVRLDHSQHYGQPQAFIDQINHVLSQPGEHA